MVVLTLLGCIFAYITNCRLEAIQADRKGKIFALHHTLILFLPDKLPYNTLVSPVTVDNRTGASVSWREQVANYYQGLNLDDTTDYSHLFRASKYKNDNFTSYVAVVDKKTLWDENIRGMVLQANFAFDKILLLEIDEKKIPWDSCQDYDIEAAMNLWNREQKSRYVIPGSIFPKQDLMYVTIKGNIGFISDFKTKEEFQSMLVLNDEESLILEFFADASELYNET